MSVQDLSLNYVQSSKSAIPNIARNLKPDTLGIPRRFFLSSE
jgi:hypothetical protein